MPQNYVPIFLFLAVVGILIPVTLLIATIIRTQSPNRVKLMPYECGIDPYDSAGRLTAGNLWFPTRIVVSPLRVSRVKRRLFSRSEESISISQVASVKISTGILWSDILIESTGGTDPIASHGHRKADAVRIRDLIEGFHDARR